MTTQRIVLPYMRSPIHVPRRDLVLGAGDSMALEVAIVEYDDPSAPALDISGGIGGPALTLFIWPSGYWPRSWDYGAWWPLSPSTPLWSGVGTVSGCGPGTFDIVFPPNTMACWPRRCEWSMQLAWDHDAQGAMLACGNLHVRPGGRLATGTPTALTTSGNAMMTTPDSGLVA